MEPQMNRTHSHADQHRVVTWMSSHLSMNQSKTIIEAKSYTYMDQDTTMIGVRMVYT